MGFAKVLLAPFLVIMLMSLPTAQSSTGGDGRTPVKFRAFLDWFMENGGHLDSGLEVTPDAHGGYRIVATKDIIPNPTTPLISLPMLLTLNSKSATLCPIIGRTVRGIVKHAVPDNVDFLVTLNVAIHLLYERSIGGASFWAPYIAVIPRKYANTNYWSAGDFDGLLVSGGLAYEMKNQGAIMERALELFKDIYTPALPSVFGDETIYNTDSIVWAMTSVLTRSFGEAGKGTGDKAMTPVIDLVNHSSTPEGYHQYNPDHDSIELRQSHAVGKGEALTISYGRQTSAHMLAQYGFVVADNPDDRLVMNTVASLENLSASSKEGQEHLTARLDLITRESFATKPTWFTYDGSPGPGLLQLLRVAFMKACESRLLEDAAKSTAPVSIANEARVYRFLLSALRERMITLRDAISKANGLPETALQGMVLTHLQDQRKMAERAYFKSTHDWEEWSFTLADPGSNPQFL